METAIAELGKKSTDSLPIGFLTLHISSDVFPLTPDSANAQEVVETFIDYLQMSLQDYFERHGQTIEISLDVLSVEPGSIKVGALIKAVKKGKNAAGAIIGLAAAVLTLEQWVHEHYPEKHAPPIVSPDNAYQCEVEQVFALTGTRTVQYGDTLNAIAKDIAACTTTHYGIIARVLFVLNRHAFGDSVDELNAGATLVLPDLETYQQLYVELIGVD